MTELLGFTTEQASRVTGLTTRQLRYWDKTGFFITGLENGAELLTKLYSFRSLVGLRTIAELRTIHHVPLHELRKVGAELAARHQTPWASLTLYVSGRRVFFDDPFSGRLSAVRPKGQTALPIAMTRIAHETQAAVNRLRQRDSEQIGKINQKRNIVHNEPVVEGTRIATKAIWNLSSAGYDTAGIIREYPGLTPKDIEAAVNFERRRREDKAG